jgi:GPH family glycoside/pentoside/hexuronide:cation symporter
MMNQPNEGARMAQAVQGQRFSVARKLIVGSGQSVETAVAFVAATFLLYYLTNVCGIDPTVAGTILFVSLAVDAVADPLIGAWSDRLRSRWGRRLPFMVVALPIVCLAIFALFAMPTGWGSAAVITCALLANIVLRVSTSVYALPYAAMTAELTTDYGERSSIAAYRALFSFVAAVACAVPAFHYIFNGQQKMSDAGAYAQLGMLAAAVIFATGAICLLGMRSMPRSQGSAQLSGVSRGSVATDVRQLFQNHSFVVLFIACLLCLVIAGSLQALNLYAYQYYWHLTPAQTQQGVLTLQAGFLIGIPLALLLLRVVEKRTAMATGFVTVAIAQGLFPLLAKLELFAAIPATVVVCAISLVFGFCSSMLFITMQSMVADAVDEHEYRFGNRCEGLYYSSLIFATKAANGLGSLLAGLMLSAAGLKGVQSLNGPAALSEEGAAVLGMLWGPGHGLLFLLLVPILLCYRIDRREHSRIIAALAQRAATA